MRVTLLVLSVFCATASLAFTMSDLVGDPTPAAFIKMLLPLILLAIGLYLLKRTLIDEARESEKGESGK